MKKSITDLALVIVLSTLASAQQYKVLWNFASFPVGDGAFPQGNLVFDGSGNLYGTTKEGGVNNSGSVFELSPNSSGGWDETVLYSFCSVQNGYPCADGAIPETGLVIDLAGNLYGTTSEGGNTQCTQCSGG